MSAITTFVDRFSMAVHPVALPVLPRGQWNFVLNRWSDSRYFRVMW